MSVNIMDNLHKHDSDPFSPLYFFFIIENEKELPKLTSDWLDTN